ncbi:MAG: DUF2867 domain-containing protein [Deltaproteobacteria bacterium]|nr:DUF2867 domain-containing protein [Deltaproteobacteria bacterium]
MNGRKPLDIWISKFYPSVLSKQTARFLPRGLAGIGYWYSLVPFHQWAYRGMLAAIAAAVGKPVVKGPEPCKISSRRHAKK